MLTNHQWEIIAIYPPNQHKQICKENQTIKEWDRQEQGYIHNNRKEMGHSTKLKKVAKMNQARKKIREKYRNNKNKKVLI